MRNGLMIVFPSVSSTRPKKPTRSSAVRPPSDSAAPIRTTRFVRTFPTFGVGAIGRSLFATAFSNVDCAAVAPA